MNATNFDPYRAPETALGAQRDARHSRVGIASLFAFVACVLGIAVVLVSVGRALASVYSDDAEVGPPSSYLRFALPAFLFAISSAGVGVVLGLLGCMQRDRLRLTGRIGLTLNGLIIASLIALVVYIAVA